MSDRKSHAITPRPAGHHDLHGHSAHDTTRGHARIVLNATVLGWAVALTVGFAAVEFAASLLSGSMALMADAGHMITDATALFLALAAQIIARRPPTETSSYGDGRAEALAAFVNSLAMLAMVIWIAWEAIHRFQQPHRVEGITVMAVAAIGLLVNLVVAWLLSKDQHNLNSKAALIHVLGDLLGSIAAIIAGAVVTFTGWTPIDPLLSLLVCVLILKSTLSLLRSSTRILMEHVPDSVNFKTVGADLQAMRSVTRVHNLHIWETMPGEISLTAHLEVDSLAHWPEVLHAAQQMLRDRHGIDHATLQPELVTIRQAADGQSGIPAPADPQSAPPASPQ
ncbi:MAG: cation transporter [Betaproteobacteria bacterium]|nr:cation transporter [Betaproteobacteria bacterium]